MKHDTKEFNRRYLELKVAWHKNRIALKIIEDQIDWFERAEYLIEQGQPPLLALLTVDHEAPSCYKYHNQIKKLKKDLAQLDD